MFSIKVLTQFVEQHEILSHFLLFLGVVIEGELALITAGVLAHLGAFSFWSVFLTGIAGAVAKSFLWYRLGVWLDIKVPKNRFFTYIENRVLAFLPHFCERPFWSIFGSKFIYGVNHFTLIFCGFKKIRFGTFIKAEFYSSILWVLGIVSLGYYLSYAAFGITRDIRKFTLLILLFIIGFLVLEKVLSFIVTFLEEYFSKK